MILAPSGLDERRLSQVLDTIMSRGVDYADLYFALSREESWSLEDGIVKEGAHSIEQGVGVRAISGEKTGFAYTDEVLLPALLEASDAARAIARSGGKNGVKAWQRPLTHRLYLPVDPLDAIKDEDKVAWLMRIDADTRRLDPRVKQVMASLAAVHEIVLIASSDGTLAADVRPLVRVNVSVIVEQNGRREQGYSGGGGRFGLDELLQGDAPVRAWTRGRAPSAGESGSGGRAGGFHDGGAGSGLAGHFAARGDRSWIGGRLQPQGYLGLLESHRPESRRRRCHGGR